MKNSKNKLYVKILMTLILNNMVTTYALLTLDTSMHKIYRTISEAEKNKHIRSAKFTHRIKGHPYQISYYTITSSGIRYLRDHNKFDYPWLDVFQQDISHLSIRGRNCGNEVIERFLRVSTSAVIAYSAGAKTSPVFLAAPSGQKYVAEEIKNNDAVEKTDCDIDNLNEKTTLAQLVTYAFTQGKHQDPNSNEKIKEIIAAKSMVYFNSSEMKTTLSSTDTIIKSKDPSFARYTGVLANHLKSVLVYMSSSAGIKWPSRIVKKEIAAFTRFNSLYIGYNRVVMSVDCRALILVTNARVFENIIKDSFQLRSKRDVLGAPFSHLYVIPVTSDGVAQINWLMSKADDNDLNKHTITQATKSGLYKTNNSNCCNWCPLISNAGEFIFIGVILDIMQLKTFIRLKNSNPNYKYGILCWSWQSDYYKRIFDDVTIYNIEQFEVCGGDIPVEM